MATINIRGDALLFTGPPFVSYDYTQFSYGGRATSNSYKLEWRGSNLSYTPGIIFPTKGVLTYVSASKPNDVFLYSATDFSLNLNSVPAALGPDTLIYGYIAQEDYNNIYGSDIDDLLLATDGDTVYGGLGTDTLLVLGYASAFSISNLNDTYSSATVSDNLSGAAVDVISVEKLQFLDGTKLLSSYTTPSYLLNSLNSTVNEGSTATFNLTTTNVAAGTAVAYTISGISASDVTGGKLSGSVTVGSDGKATISVPIAADQTTEGDETLTVTVQGKSASTVVKDTSIGTSTTTKSALTVLVDKGVLGPTPTLLKGLAEEIISNGTAKLSHTVTYNGVKFNYADIDPLIMTVLRDGNFTDEFRQEIADLVPSLKDISFDVAVKFVGTANIDSVIVNVAGADGNFVI